ncbi:hypothetical protein SSX86_002180 [Deinandra increscens subsp. villosa]|uniref:ADP-ribosyl cyclase/cyclic ADP-ribose hydrolase n=1 Tax=Deinandra increscens subsp. villosa TaxID=3103831 RepID=A0AAP0DRW2_9ASTR
MASSSTSSMLKYDVFLSFRGEDTRKTFVDHLYSALHQKGILTFQDSEKLERGKSISEELLKAIGESSIAVIVFSKNYASSSWCLDELVEIMRQHKEMKQIVYPVFYGVDPSDVRKQKGPFGEGFGRHRQSGKAKAWKEALVEAANLSGWDTNNNTNGHEAECVKTIVKDIQGSLYHKYSILEEKLIGIIPRVEKVKSLLIRTGTGLNDVRMIGIWGMGGAGKTTIARSVFTQLSSQFDITMFVRNVREMTEKSGLHSVQKELLSCVDKNMEIENVVQGMQMIKKVFCRQKVLIVLDDVDQISQLDALAGDHKWFAEGSRIIITTRDERLLVAHGIIEDIYNVDLMNSNEALQLFSLHAFRINIPMEDYEQHSRLVVHYAGGHPLTLKVLGNSLRGRDMTKWITTLDRLKEIPKTETLETLKVSFDALEDIEKEIFLDIVCFFKGWHSMEVYKILDCCGFDTQKWVCDLIQKSLIYISNERLNMHDMIQEMGQHIVRGKNPKEPHKHSRLWRYQEVLDIFRENKGTEEIEAIVVEGLCTSERVNLTNTFKNMTNLRLLHVDTMGMHFIGPEYLPSSLQYLNWKNYTSNSFPENFGSGKLVGLHMHSSSIVQLWKGVKHLHNLKYVDCKESKNLSRTPNFAGVPNLESLNLSGCSSLVKVHKSIGNLEKLKILDLSNCYELRSFPSYVNMKSLEMLDLCHCRNFKKFPEIQGTMERLSHIYLEHTTIQELPSSIVNLPNLSFLSLLGCINLVTLPHSICMLQSLIYLDVRRCIKLATVPQELGNIGCLEHLLVSSVTQLPSSIIRLKNLKTFSVVEPPSSIFQKRGFLDWFFSKQANSKHKNLPQYSLYQVLPSLSSLTSLNELGLCNLHEGTILPVDIGTLSSLEYLILCNNQFSRLPFTIFQLSVLRRLDLSNCPNLEALPELPPSVAVVFANNCKLLRTITGLSSAQGLLRQVSFLGCRGLEHQLVETLTATVLQTALQGCNVMKQQTSILLPGSEIPQWFQNETTGVGQAVIKLPENWYNVITGISLCVVADFMGLTRPVRLTLSTEPILSVNGDGLYHPDRLHMWMEYVSFDLLQRSIVGIVRPDWITTTPGLILTISTESSGVKICGARLIYKELNLENINGSMDDVGGVLKRQTNLLKCFRETEYDAITYSLQSGIKYIPEGDAWFDRLSWNKKHEYYRSGKSSMKVGMNILD